MAIRRHGPGKFNTIIDGYVYELTLDGSGESLGDAETFNHYDAVTLGKEGLKAIAEIAKEDPTHDGGKRHGDLTLEEARLIRKSYGAIVEENSQGFVRIEYFKTQKGFEKAWARLEREWEKFEEEAGEGD